MVWERGLLSCVTGKGLGSHLICCPSVRLSFCPVVCLILTYQSSLGTPHSACWGASYFRFLKKMFPQRKVLLQGVRGRCLTVSPRQSAKRGHQGSIFSRPMRPEWTSLLQKTIVFCRIRPKVGAFWQRKNEAQRNKAMMRTLVRAGLKMPFAADNNSLAEPRNIWINNTTNSSVPVHGALYFNSLFIYTYSYFSFAQTL